MSCSDWSRSATGATGKSREAGAASCRPETRGSVSTQGDLESGGEEKRAGVWQRTSSFTEGRAAAGAQPIAGGRRTLLQPSPRRPLDTTKLYKQNQLFFSFQLRASTTLTNICSCNRGHSLSTTHALAARGLSLHSMGEWGWGGSRQNPP